MLPDKLIHKMGAVPLSADHFNAYFNSYTNDVPMGVQNKRKSMIQEIIRLQRESPTPTHEMYYNNYSIQLQLRSQIADTGLNVGVFHIIDAKRTDRVLIPSSYRSDETYLETYEVIVDTDLPSLRIILNYDIRHIPLPDSYSAILAVHRMPNGTVQRIRVVNTTLYEPKDILINSSLNHSSTIFAINEIIVDIYRTRVCINHITIDKISNNGNIYTLTSPIHGVFRLTIDKISTSHGELFKYTILEPPMWLRLEPINTDKYLSCYDEDTLEKYVNIKDKKKCVIM